MSKSTQKKRGRPPMPSDKLKSEAFLLRLDAKEKEAFSESADLAGVSLAAWMRERLRRAARMELAEAGRPVAFLHAAS